MPLASKSSANSKCTVSPAAQEAEAVVSRPVKCPPTAILLSSGRSPCTAAVEPLPERMSWNCWASPGRETGCPEVSGVMAPHPSPVKARREALEKWAGQVNVTGWVLAIAAKTPEAARVCTASPLVSDGNVMVCGEVSCTLIWV